MKLIFTPIAQEHWEYWKKQHRWSYKPIGLGVVNL
jgi:hypothetical protein